jgi:hypothetical protein
MPKVIMELIIVSAAIFLEVFLWIASDDIPPASGTYPRALIGLAFVLSAAFMLMRLYSIRRTILIRPDELPVAGSTRQIMVLCGMVCVYLLLLEPVGYAIMTLSFIFICLFYLGMRSKLVLLLTPLFLTGFTYYIFNNVLFVFLPKGVLDY